MKMNPYLIFNGNCEEAFVAYEKILRGKIQAMMRHAGTPAETHVPAEWRDKIIHASLTFGGNTLMASDAPPSSYEKMQGTTVSLQRDEPAEAERLYNALSDGGKVTLPLGETFFAQKFGMLVDRFGTPWMIHCAKPMAQ